MVASSADVEIIIVLSYFWHQPFADVSFETDSRRLLQSKQRLKSVVALQRIEAEKSHKRLQGRGPDSCSVEEKRILLTRDRGLLKRSEITDRCCVRATDPEQQLIEVIRRSDLESTSQKIKTALVERSCLLIS